MEGATSMRLRDLHQGTETPEVTDVDPETRLQEAIDHCLGQALGWLGWTNEIAVAEHRVWTPHKSMRRIADHLIDHTWQIECLVSGAPIIEDTWHGSFVTMESDWARFT